MSRLFLPVWIAFGLWMIHGVWTAGSKPDPSLDLTKCWAQHQNTYWDGPDGTRHSASDYRAIVFCWPKKGCFMWKGFVDGAPIALCWQHPAELKP